MNNIPNIDETWLEEVISDLRDEGLYEESIQCIVDEIREGSVVEVYGSINQNHIYQ